MRAQLSKILRMTKCKQPCQYKEYKIAEDPPNEFPEDQYGNETVFGIWPVSENTEKQKEVLIGSGDLTLDGDLRKSKLPTGKAILQRWHYIKQNPLIGGVKFADDDIATMITEELVLIWGRSRTPFTQD